MSEDEEMYDRADLMYEDEYDTIRCAECEALPGRCNCGAPYVPTR